MYRLVFGVGRSGTTWISTVLSQTTTPIRFLREPLHTRRLHDIFRTSITYEDNINEYMEKYKTYLSKKAQDISCKNKRIIRNDENFEYCLIKEVHGLLAVEHIIKKFDCKVILIVRNVLRILDSLLCLPELNNTYLKAESKHMSNNFLKKFSYLNEMPSIIGQDFFDKRKRLIVEKLLTIAILNKMFYSLSKTYNNVYLVSYEEFCKDPINNFKKVFDFFDFEYNDIVEDFIYEINSKTNNKDRSFRRVTSKQLEKEFKYLSLNEIDMCNNILDKNYLNFV